MAKKKDKCCDWFSKMKSMHGKNNECGCGYPMMFHHGNGFLGRLIFILGIMMALNVMGIAVAVPVWIKTIIVIGFAMLRF